MRALARMAAMSALSLGVSLPSIMSGGAGMPRFVREPRKPGEERVDPKTARAREKGKRDDPFFGLKSKGRTGATARMVAMADAFAKTKVGKRNIRGRKAGDAFKSDRRNAVFNASIIAGKSRNDALKLARRVPA